MDKVKVNKVLSKILDIMSLTELNNLFCEVAKGNFTPIEVDFDSLTEKMLWEGIDPKFKYLALEENTGSDLCSLYYFETEPNYFYGIWDIDCDFIHDQFRVYRTTMIPEDTLFSRPYERNNSLLS
jgi:hypothetical protein